jgi:hypothetical protein
MPTGKKKGVKVSKFKNYIKKTLQPLRPYIEGEDLKSQGISVRDGDTPEAGGMVAKNPKDPEDMWYMTKKFFEDNYIPVNKRRGSPRPSLFNG